MVPQPQIHFAKHNLKKLRCPVSILIIPKDDATHVGQPLLTVPRRPGRPDKDSQERLSYTTKAFRRTGAKKVVRGVFSRPSSNGGGIS
jgi:hypothetical protein